MKKTARMGMRAKPDELQLWRMMAKQEGMSLSGWMEMLANQRAQQLAAMLLAKRQ